MLDKTFVLSIQSITWVFTLASIIALGWWVHKIFPKGEMKQVGIPAMFYLLNQLAFYTSILVSRYFNATVSELYGIEPGMSELWSAILRLHGTITLLAIVYIIKSIILGLKNDLNRCL